MRITEETFQDSCKETLSEFLKGYASRKRHFNSEHIQKVNEKVPDFFRKKSVEESDGVFVLWHVDNSLLILAGLKDEVEKKEKEITDFLHKTVPRYLFLIQTGPTMRGPWLDFTFAACDSQSDSSVI